MITEIQKQLMELSEPEYGDFIAKLTPTVPREFFIGVRVPALRKIEKAIRKSPDLDQFLDTLPHQYYEENLLHSIILQNAKDYDKTVERVEAFLPYIDNWAVCDTLRPNSFKKHKAEILPHARRWMASDETYTCRFGVDILMEYFLDEDFDEEYLAWPAAIDSDEYYVKMMVAWYFATALAKQWDATIPYIEQRRLPEWTHRKAIQKAIESNRITDEQKAYLRTLK